jgi:outer membrane protein TolC
MIKQKLYLLVLISITGMTCTQAQITLQSCLSDAVTAYPQAKDKDAYKQALTLKLENTQTAYLPQISLNGQATYQSDAIDITMSLPSNTLKIKQSKDQYKITLDVNQLLYDGGATRYQKKILQSSLETDLNQVDVELQKIKEQVNSVYFSLLIQQASRKQLQTTIDDLKEREKEMTSMVKNGVINNADLDVLVAERLKVEQQITEIDLTYRSTLDILGILTNKKIPDNEELVLPEIILDDSIHADRPETKLFDAQSQMLEDSKLMTKIALRPKVAAFAQAGYGRPGLNMLSDEFNPFYIVGASVKWTLWDWKKNQRDRQVLEVQKTLVESRKENFDRNLNIDLKSKRTAINKMQEAITRDSVIVSLRQGITKTSKSRLNNGVITSTEYVNNLNAESIARISMELHKLQLVQAKVNYQITMGK